MKKLLITIFLSISCMLFANINDSLNLLPAEDKKVIEQKISEIKANKKLNVYVNTMQVGEGFRVEEPEKTLMLNLKKEQDKNKYEVEISFSKDIDVEEKSEELDEILAGAEEILKSKEYKNYIVTLLDGISAAISDVDVNDANPYKLTEEQPQQKSKTKQAILILILAIVVIKGVEEFKKYNKKKKHKNKKIEIENEEEEINIKK